MEWIISHPIWSTAIGLFSLAIVVGLTFIGLGIYGAHRTVKEKS